MSDLLPDVKGRRGCESIPSIIHFFAWYHWSQTARSKIKPYQTNVKLGQLEYKKS